MSPNVTTNVSLTKWLASTLLETLSTVLGFSAALRCHLRCMIIERRAAAAWVAVSGRSRSQIRA